MSNIITTETNRIIAARDTIKNKCIELNLTSNASAKIDELANNISNINNLGQIDLLIDNEISNTYIIDSGYTTGGSITVQTITYYYYNDLRLPKIPADVVSAYPYYWIRDNYSTGNYDLIMGTTSFYYDRDNTRLKHRGSDSDLWYRIAKSTSESATSWGSPVSHSFVGWTIDSNRIAHWSNHDVTTSSTSQNIYLEGSDPIPDVSAAAFLSMVEEVL